MLADKTQLLDLIPQRHPMMMIDTLLDCNDEFAVSSFRIQGDNIFCKDSVFLESGMIENIAQTCSAYVGYYSKTNNEQIPLGFIAGIKNLKVFKRPTVNAEIITNIKIQHKIMNFTIIEGSIYDNNELAAQCEMKIFLDK